MFLLEVCSQVLSLNLVFDLYKLLHTKWSLIKVHLTFCSIYWTCNDGAIPEWCLISFLLSKNICLTKAVKLESVNAYRLFLNFKFTQTAMNILIKYFIKTLLRNFIKILSKYSTKFNLWIRPVSLYTATTFRRFKWWNFPLHLIFPARQRISFRNETRNFRKLIDLLWMRCSNRKIMMQTTS